jgi:hypothetical protein
MSKSFRKSVKSPLKNTKKLINKWKKLKELKKRLRKLRRLKRNKK